MAVRSQPSNGLFDTNLISRHHRPFPQEDEDSHDICRLTAAGDALAVDSPCLLCVQSVAARWDCLAAWVGLLTVLLCFRR